MKIFANRETKYFFLEILAVMAVLFSAVAVCGGVFYKEFSPLFLLLFLLAAACMTAVCIHYFDRQNKVMEEAVHTIHSYLDGDKSARIDCDREGELYRLFHSVNTLAAVLNAHAEKELQAKEFLKGTISDISHQLKTPLAALNIYTGLIQDEADAGEMSAIREFAVLSEQELDRIDTLVQNLLKIAKWDAGSIMIEKAPENVADMGIRMEKARMIASDGNWHIMLKNISQSETEEVILRPDVAAAARYDVINYRIDKDYFIGGKKAVLCGADEVFATDIMNIMEEGVYPQNDSEIVITANAREFLNAALGDTVTVDTPSGSFDYTISGFCGNVGYTQEHDAFGAFVNMTAFQKILEAENGGQEYNPVYYVRFRDHINVRKVITGIKEQYGWTEANVAENTGLLGLTGFSSDSYMMGLYLIAAVLFVLVLMAGIFMIAGSINSNIAERTQFFGMMRCIGASRRQIIRFVRLEALNWCKVAVPIGVVSGILMTWGICAVLRLGVGGEFSDMPLFGLSAVGIVSGVVAGVLTVLLAARSPAKRASRVSPVMAVSGNASKEENVSYAVNAHALKIEMALGVRHAISARKNFLFITGSFALSIILFMGFSVGIEWLHHALNPLKPYAPDLSIVSSGYSCSIERDLIDEVKEAEGVERAFGRMYRGDVSTESEKGVDRIDLISYEEYQFGWAKEAVVSGDVKKVQGDGNYVLVVYEDSNPFETGDRISVGGQVLEVAGVLSESPFSSTDTPTVICSEETFTRLTGERDYAIIDIQLTGRAGDEEVNAIRDLAGGGNLFSDRRMSNREVMGTYWMFSLLVYGFLSIIAMITLVHIVNSISMSVSARIKQYGAMRAVGMDGRQITKMIAAEAFTYALSGCAVGCIFGLAINKLMYQKLISDYFGDIWRAPVSTLVITLLFVLAASAAAVYAPAGRIRDMAITDVINEL